MPVRPALASEAAALSALAIRSKAHWGYDRAAMDVFRSELTMSAQELIAGDAHVLEDEVGTIGFYTLTPGETGTVELEHLFVDPGRLRGGHGSRLLEHARARARERGFVRMEVLADPNAEGFYTARGARLLERVPSSLPDRSLPRMAIPLDVNAD